MLLFILGVNSRCPVPGGVQVLEQLRLGAGEQHPERPVSTAGMAALDVLTECQLERAWLDRGRAVVGSVFSPARLGSQDRSYFLALEITARFGAVAARLKVPMGTFCCSGQSL